MDGLKSVVAALRLIDVELGDEPIDAPRNRPLDRSCGAEPQRRQAEARRQTGRQLQRPPGLRQRAAEATLE
jgi:hypothetical protein